MIRRLIHHLRGNAVAYVALFIALGGTSYAAVSLPRNSVGARQLRRGAVTPAKLGAGIGGEVWAVTEVNDGGGVVMSDPGNVQVRDWRANMPGSISEEGIIDYPRPIPRACLPVATSDSFVNVDGQDHLPGVSAVKAGSGVELGADSPAFITVSILCPR